MKKQASSWLALLAAFALFAAACGDDEAAPAAPDTSAADAAAAEAEAAAAAAQADAAAAEAEAAAAAVQADAASADAEAATAKAADAEAALEAAKAEAVDPEVVAELEAQLQEAEAEAAAAKAAAAEAAAEAEAAAAAAAEEPMEEMSMTPGEGVRVIQARANWSQGYMQGAIYRALLQELGYNVSDPADLELAPSNAFLAMAEGEFDFWVNTWRPNHDKFTSGELSDASLVSDHVSDIGGEMLGGALQGFLTNKSLVDAHGIKTLDDIVSNSEVFAIYDAADSTPNDGVLQLLGCPEGWGCRIVIQDTLEKNGWNNVEQIEVGGYTGVIGEAVARHADDKPYIVYTWTPTAYPGELGLGVDSIWLAQSEDAVVDEQRGASPLGPETCSDTPCNLTFKPADIVVTANSDFLAANPAAAKLFEQVKVSLVDVTLQNVKASAGEDTPEDVIRHAAEWIAANRDAVDEWLAAARAAA